MNLYKPEMMKIRLSVYLMAVSGIFACILMIGLLFLFILKLEGGGSAEDIELFGEWSGLLALVTALSFACFGIFCAAVAARVIVMEYCGENAVILLCYPVSRRAVLGTKVLLTCMITAVSASVSNVLVIGIMYITAYIFGVEPQTGTGNFAFTVLCASVLMGAAASAAGMIAAVIGWKKRSSMAAIVSALIIVCAVTNLFVLSPENIVWIIFMISAAFIAAAAFSCRMLEKGIMDMEV